MEIRVLRYFLMIAEEESFTRAADKLHITQPTLSRQMNELEEELGTVLFIRNKKNILLTADGVRLKRRAEEIVDLADKTEAEFTAKDQLSGTITIGMGESFASDFAAEWMHQFREEYPQVHFGLYTGNADQIQERVDAGIIDIGIMLDPFSTERYESFRIPVRERIGVIMRSDHPLCSKKTIHPDDLNGIEILLTGRKGGDSTEWLKRTKAVTAGYHDLPGNAVHYVEKTNALAVTCEGACTYIDPVRFQWRPLADNRVFGASVIWRDERTLSEAARRFVKAGRELAQREKRNDDF